MNKSILMLMVLAILPISARMIAQDSEVYELRTKLKYAEDFARLHPDPGYLWAQKQSISNKLDQLAQREKQQMAQQPQQQSGFSSGFGGARATRGFANPSGFGAKPVTVAPVIVPEKSTDQLEQEAQFREMNEKERADLEKQLADLDKIPEKRMLYDLAQNNLAKVKEAYDKALKNYFELKDIS